jgi:hypothetical protein
MILLPKRRQQFTDTSATKTAASCLGRLGAFTGLIGLALKSLPTLDWNVLFPRILSSLGILESTDIADVLRKKQLVSLFSV